jgi:hypothetical protein
MLTVRRMVGAVSICVFHAPLIFGAVEVEHAGLGWKLQPPDGFVRVPEEENETAPWQQFDVLVSSIAEPLFGVPAVVWDRLGSGLNKMAKIVLVVLLLVLWVKKVVRGAIH